MTPEEKAAIDAAEEEAKDRKNNGTLSERDNEIKARAKKVHELSFEYHLVHAVFGSVRLLTDDIEESNKDKYAVMNKALVKAEREKNEDIAKELVSEIKELNEEVESKRHLISIRYSNINDEHGGRVVYNPSGKRFFILLSEKLKKGLVDEKKHFNLSAVEKIREKMAHELGHIVLHGNLLPIDDQTGSGNIKGHLDSEADVFKTELLRLYDLKNHCVKCSNAKR